MRGAARRHGHACLILTRSFVSAADLKNALTQMARAPVARSRAWAQCRCACAQGDALSGEEMSELLSMAGTDAHGRFKISELVAKAVRD